MTFVVSSLPAGLGFGRVQDGLEFFDPFSLTNFESFKAALGGVSVWDWAKVSLLNCIWVELSGLHSCFFQPRSQH